LYYTASGIIGIITPVGGRPVHRLREYGTFSHGVHTKYLNLANSNSL